MKLEIRKCPAEFVERIDDAARACGSTRQHFIHRVLDAASRAVAEREEQIQHFEEFMHSRRIRARAYF
jgi:hypothetical protein